MRRDGGYMTTPPERLLAKNGQKQPKTDGVTVVLVRIIFRVMVLIFLTRPVTSMEKKF
jgi:hypothetical protein